MYRHSLFYSHTHSVWLSKNVIQIGKCIIPIDRQTDLNFLAGVLKVLVDVC